MAYFLLTLLPSTHFDPYKHFPVGIFSTVIVASDKVESLEVADTASSSSPSSASSTDYNRSLNTPPTSILTLTPSSMAEAKNGELLLTRIPIKYITLMKRQMQ